MARDLVESGAYMGIPSRKLTEETCRKFGLSVTTLSDGRGVTLAPYYSATGGIIAQKVRPKDKDSMFTTGDLKAAMLFGQQLWGQGGRKVVVTEGEFDAMSVSQVQGNKWPVVSIPNGAQGAAVSIRRQLEWLETYEEVILMFDQDAPGQAAVEECVQLFSPGKVKVARLPRKDANECLTNGEGEAIISAIWNAKPWRPEGILTVADVFDQAILPPAYGKPWCFQTMTDWTYGRRPGELYGFGAGTGIGKTDLFTQQIAFDVQELGEMVGVFFLEQNPVETVQRLAGKLAGKAFHIPGEAWTQDELVTAVTALRDNDKIRM